MPEPHPGADAGHRHHPPEDMRHGQEQQDRDLLVRPRLEDGVEEFDGVVDLGEEVAVGERAALGAAGGARGVDQRGQGGRAEHAPADVDLLVGDRGPGLGEPVHVPLLHHPQVPEVGDAVQLGTEGGGLRDGLGDQGDRAGVLEDPAGLEDGGGRIDRDGHQTRGPGGEVQERPLVRRPRHDRDPVARRQPLGDQPLGHGEHLLGEARRRHVRPAAVLRPTAEQHLVRHREGVVEGQVAQRSVRDGRGEGRYVCLPDDSVEAPGLRLHEGGGGSVVEGCGCGEGRQWRGHGRLLARRSRTAPHVRKGVTAGQVGDRTGLTCGGCALSGRARGRGCATSGIT